jgi:heme-degrading monooxygenase HmoA
MPYLLVRHKVKDYTPWKKFYDEHGGIRQAAGCQGTTVFRSTDDPHQVIILSEWDTLEKAQQFTSSVELREMMQKAGVIDVPDIYFLDEADRTWQ